MKMTKSDIVLWKIIALSLFTGAVWGWIGIKIIGTLFCIAGLFGFIMELGMVRAKEREEKRKASIPMPKTNGTGKEAVN